ncbi:zinc finger protein 608 [Esox lucius]|uniref:zinc finger protein 608 n=1 Tax=Esox lucius TaxID=8010 RepID=UPI001476D761|nr:zinc finger protein 608 [Esox lucius]
MTDCEELSACSNTPVLSQGLRIPSVQIQEQFSEDSRKARIIRRKTSKDSEPSVFTLCGIAEICVAKRMEAQGRPREAFEMNSTLGQAVSNPNTSDVTVSCAKGKGEKKGKNQIRVWKRERDAVRTRKEKYDGQRSPIFNSIPDHFCTLGRQENPCHCAASGMEDITKNALDCGIKGCAIVVRNNDDTGTPAKKQRTDKVDSMFTAPAPPPPVTEGPMSNAPFTPSISKQLLVRTRSIGTNTHDGGPDTDSCCLGPCQPGTSVNLEGIVWHETDEGVLVVNVTWRKRTYVGTLLDCTKHDWAPPRFCESPSSDSDLPGSRGRGKRMRLAIPDQPCVDPALTKVRGLPHKSRGGGIHSKGRRGSLNLINNCRTPPFFTVEEIKPNSLPSGKRKNKPLADLDLTLVAEDMKIGNGKRIRAKSRSAPSTPQGKSDPTFMDPACTSPILIDCPHPNCNKKYKHINGLRYHQTHAHLDIDPKPEFEAESEDRLSDCEESLSSLTFDCSEMTNNSSKKPSSLYKVSTIGSLKNRRLMLNSDHSPTATSKMRRNSLIKDGLIDDLSNLPIISNMTVVLENCLVTDRNSSVEMPKLEAEGLIDKKGASDKGKKANGKSEKCSSKSRTNRPIAPGPAPPKLIAIPNTVFSSSNATETSTQQSSPSAAVGVTATKNLSLKPIKPKLNIMIEPSLVKATIVTCKETRKKEKRRLKNKRHKDTRTSDGDGTLLKMDEGKLAGKEQTGSLLKEHLSKQDGMNGLIESQESRMASIRAEADKVYTFTDNAPSPSIGSSLRLDCGSLGSGDGTTTKTNSPAYSDISDAGDDGGSECRSDTRSKSPRSISLTEINTNNNPSSKTATAPGSVKDPQSPFYHGYDPYYLQNYMQTGQSNATGGHKNSTPQDSKCKREDMKECSDERNAPEFIDSKKADFINSSSQSQLQMAMTQTQTALAQSLYYGQYARGLYLDQKLLMASKCCEQQQISKQRGGQANREPDEIKHMITPTAVLSKGTDSVKTCCAKPGLSFVEMDERSQTLNTQSQGKPMVINVKENQGLVKDSDEMKSSMNPNNQTDLDSNVSFSNHAEVQPWPRLNQSKYVEQQTEDLSQSSEELNADTSKEWEIPYEPVTKMELKKAATQDAPISDTEDYDRLEELPMGVMSEDSQSARVAVSPPMNPQQQSFIPYQHSYQFLQMCDPNNNSYRVMSPTLVQNYPGFHYPLYGKTAGREESHLSQNNRGVSSKPASDSTALELLQHHNLPYHGKSPAPGEKGSPEAERETDRARNLVPFAKHLHTHHHTHLGMSYPLMSGQYSLFQDNEGKK